MGHEEAERVECRHLGYFCQEKNHPRQHKDSGAEDLSLWKKVALDPFCKFESSDRYYKIDLRWNVMTGPKNFLNFLA